MPRFYLVILPLDLGRGHQDAHPWYPEVSSVTAHRNERLCTASQTATIMASCPCAFVGDSHVGTLDIIISTVVIMAEVKCGKWRFFLGCPSGALVHLCSVNSRLLRLDKRSLPDSLTG